MKNILISFIRNEHLENQKVDNYEDLDISRVTERHNIDRIFLLTNQDREQSIFFKNWIAEKLEKDVKAVTLEKGSEKYILGKIESIIKYILLAEEGHASFVYLPGANTLQINLWEIVDKTIHKGSIIYPHMIDFEPDVQASEPHAEMERVKDIPKRNTKPLPKPTPIKEKKIFTVNATDIPEKKNTSFKVKAAIEKGANLLVWGEEGTGKTTQIKEAVKNLSISYHSINFRSVNPAAFEEKTSEISKLINEGDTRTFLFLNIEVLPFYIQEQLAEFNGIQIIATANIREKSDLEKINRRLYYLISKSLILLEPLRGRKDELPELIAGILKKNGSSSVFSDKALAYLERHNWPGNFNELNSLISRVSGESVPVITEDLVRNSLDRQESRLNQWRDIPMGENFNLNDVLGEVAMHYIMEALEICKGKKSKAAKMLGFSNYQTLSNWMNKYGK
ncbi:helix-turn-helix domain-containing protein [Spirochaeta isovalerica]|uniref:Transcriptional regulator with PAS, ATPase and Fis domain n=1 Tax=Spirochaeta isovalerica TaxID=150 RepID=A0A841R8T5_9SPIO|nr:helix-turn-helix domain-containing protein [Spirochaeta isovalerica]MBB6479138.1 transcriptional regulator with PAS, ATPase and Fis domain [Spirochaeta isovalerica]